MLINFIKLIDLQQQRKGNIHQSFDVKYQAKQLNKLEQVLPANATLSGKKLLAIMLNEVKTANCFLSV